MEMSKNDIYHGDFRVKSPKEKNNDHDDNNYRTPARGPNLAIIGTSLDQIKRNYPVNDIVVSKKEGPGETQCDASSDENLVRAKGQFPSSQRHNTSQGADEQRIMCLFHCNIRLIALLESNRQKSKKEGR